MRLIAGQGKDSGSRSRDRGAERSRIQERLLLPDELGPEVEYGRLQFVVEKRSYLVYIATTKCQRHRRTADNGSFVSRRPPGVDISGVKRLVRQPQNDVQVVGGREGG